MVVGAVDPLRDFGLILADDQILRHTFRIANPTSRRVGLFDPVAFTPCCSSIGQVPEAIPPGGSADVEATFRPGRQSGTRQVAFTIRADLAGRPPINLALRAHLLPAHEVKDPGSGPTVVLIGESGERRSTIVCRSEVGASRGPPTRVVATPPFTVAFDGPSRARSLPGGLDEVEQDVVVAFPGVSVAGVCSGECTLTWPDGSSWSWVVGWKVRMPIEASPPALIIGSAPREARRSVLLSSIDRPFRVLDVVGPASLDGGPSGEARSVHRLGLTIDRASPARSEVADLRIITDHPSQREVVVSVLGGSPSTEDEP